MDLGGLAKINRANQHLSWILVDLGAVQKTPTHPTKPTHRFGWIWEWYSKPKRGKPNHPWILVDLEAVQERRPKTGSQI